MLAFYHVKDKNGESKGLHMEKGIFRILAEYRDRLRSLLTWFHGWLNVINLWKKPDKSKYFVSFDVHGVQGEQSNVGLFIL